MRLLDGDGNIDGAHGLFFVDPKGVESKVALVQEDGWAMLPDKAGCRKRIAAEAREDVSLG